MAHAPSMKTHAACAAALVLAAIAAPAGAAFTLARESAKDGGAPAFVVEWSDAVRPYGDTVPAAMLAFPGEPEQFEPDQPVFVPEPEFLERHARETLAAMNASTSCLIAIPGFDDTGAADWSATVAVREGSVPEGESPVELRTVRVGAIAALQVIVDREAFAADKARRDGGQAALSIAIEPRGKALDRAGNAAGARVVMDGCEGIAARFLNGGDLLAKGGFRMAGAAKGSSSLPEPPGDWRISYQSVIPFSSGNQASSIPLLPEILKFDLTAIGGNASMHGDLRLVYDGTAIPTERTTGDTVIFFAPRTHTAYDSHNAVFASFDAGGPSPAFATRDAFATLSPGGAEVARERSRLLERNQRYERDSLNPAGERLVHWRLNSPGGNIAFYTVNLADKLTTTTMSMTARLHGLNTVNEIDPDHYADIRVQWGDTSTSRTLPRQIWEGRTEHVVAETFDLGAIPALPSPITFRHEVVAGSPVSSSFSDLQNLESFELRWTGKPRLNTDGFCRVEVADNGDTPTHVTVGGLPAAANANDVVVLDVTDPSAPVWIENFPLFADESGGKAVEFEDGGNGAVYHVQTIASIKTTASIVAAEALPALPPADTPLAGIHVRPAAFAATLAPLTALRGAGFVELDPQAAYNVYTGGRPSPDAIKQALAAIVAAAPARAALPVVLFAGHGTFDYRNALNAQVGPKIPPYSMLGTTQYFGSTREFPSDVPTMQTEGADEFPDFMFGRVAARTTAQLQNAVNRLLAWEPLAPVLAAQDRVGFIPTDNTPTGDPIFGMDGPLWLAYWAHTGMPGYHYDFTNEADSGIVIRDTLENGKDGVPTTGFCLYVGHGNFSRWASTLTLTNTMVTNTIVTQDKWPFMVALTCQNGIYSVPPTLEAQFSMADAWLLAPVDKGALGSLCTTTEQGYLAMRPIVEEVMKGFGPFHGQKATNCGELYVMGMTGFMTTYPALTYNAYGYHLFGDPSASLGLDTTFNLAVPDWRALE